MGGKSYFCDYCHCYLKNDINVRKKHNTGVAHTIAKVSYMRRFEDPKRLLAEERAKLPCNRYVKGFCKFDLFCQFSHFNAKQLQELQKIVNKLAYKAAHGKTAKKTTNTTRLLQLPWQGKHDLLKRRKRTKLPKQLPVSLRPIKFNKLNNKHFELQWG